MKKLSILAFLLTIVILTACRSTGSSVKGGSGTDSGTTFSAKNYLEKVVKNHSTQTHLTAKVKLTISVGSKSLSTSGSLKMKRDDVIQLSVVDPLIGVTEIGRMEFTTNKVLIIDRFNKQYIDVPYSDVGFLSRANLDFYSLQSLFWNEVFQPGEKQPRADAFTYTRSTAGTNRSEEKVNMTFRDEILSYDFTTQADNGRLIQTSIWGNNNSNAQFSTSYADFSAFEGSSFPRQITLKFTMDAKQGTLALRLSSVHNATDWVTRSTVPSKYTKANPEKIFQSLVK